jgi:hypothetical protein
MLLLGLRLHQECFEPTVRSGRGPNPSLLLSPPLLPPFCWERSHESAPSTIQNNRTGVNQLRDSPQNYA